MHKLRHLVTKKIKIRAKSRFCFKLEGIVQVIFNMGTTKMSLPDALWIITSLELKIYFHH
jgi:hypothetical protein